MAARWRRGRDYSRFTQLVFVDSRLGRDAVRAAPGAGAERGARLALCCRHQRTSAPMIAKLHSLLVTLAVALAAATGAAAEGNKPHRVAIHVDQNDPAVMNLALNNARHIIEHYREKHEDAEAEIVTYGPGIH